MRKTTIRQQLSKKSDTHLKVGEHRFLTKLILAIALALLSTGLMQIKGIHNIFYGLENRVTDRMFLLRKIDSKTYPEIVIVYLDDESLMSYGYRSPVPRPLLTDLINTIGSFNPRVIGLDVLLDRQYILEDDQNLADVLNTYSDKIVLVSGESNLPPSENGLSFFNQIETSITWGYSEIMMGSDDVVRWAAFGKKGKNLSFSEAIYTKYLVSSTNQVFPDEIKNQSALTRINFLGPPDQLNDSNPKFLSLAASEVQNAAKELFKNRIVLIGVAVEGFGNNYQTPFSTALNDYKTTFGIEIQATIIEMFINQSWILDTSDTIFTLTCFSVAFFSALLVLYLSPPLYSILILILALFLPLFSFYLFVSQNLVFPILKLELIIIFTILILQSILHFEDLKRTRFLQYLFSKVENSLASSQQEVKDLTISKTKAIENERKRISRELHDEMGQSLASIKLDLEYLNREGLTDKIAFKGKTLNMIEQVNDGLKSVQKIISDLRPTILDDLGIIAAIEWLSQDFERRTGIFCRLTVIPEEFGLDIDMATDVYRMVQELLTNIIKHAKASMIRITINKGKTLKIQVTDNGSGFPKNNKISNNSFGIIGMKERVQKHSGKMQIRSIESFGTSIKITLPIQEKLV